MRIRTITTLAVVAVGTAAVFAPQASAKTEKFKVVVHAKTSGTKLSDPKCKGNSVFKGKCVLTGTLVVPNVTLKFAVKGGTLSVKYTGIIKGSNVSAKAKWGKGTGKYKKLKGTVNVKGGLIEGSSYTYSGTLSY